MKNFYFKLPKLSLLAFFLIFATTLFASPRFNVPISMKQPDGTVLNCFVSGDEFHNWLHDANGYTIIQHPQTGYYVFAIEEKGKLRATEYIAGKFDPATKGLKPFANIPASEVQKKREQYKVKRGGIDIHNAKSSKIIAPLLTNAATVMNNVVVFIKFSEDGAITEPLSYYSDIYNAASSSVNDYFLEASYDQFTVSSDFYPAPVGGNVVWYTDSQPRNYYRPYNAATNTIGYDPNVPYNNSTNTSGKTYREHTLLKNAINAIASSVSGINIDINSDDYVDCISFIVAGTNDSWNDLLWPHQWSLWSQDVFIGTKQVGDYTFQLQYFSSNRIDLGTLCHEMFHVIGSPDLYHYDENSTISPVGRWDIMDNTLDVPQHMTSYMKYLYGGWLSNIPEISSTGTYTLNPLTTSMGTEVKYCYKIPSPNTHTEYFWVEFRKQENYDFGLPGSGLLVYRINSRLEGNGNADGPPDEIYVYRPNGTTIVNGNPSSAYFNSTVNRISINDGTNPKSFLSDGTDGGLNISNVGAAGSTISFDATINFIPLVVIKNDNGASSSIGNGATPFSVATRFLVSDLVNYVGRHITKVDYFINEGSGSNVTIKVWEGGSFANPGTLVYQKNISSGIQFNMLATHSLDKSVEIKANKEYWVGYSIVPTGGYPIATDRGPMIQDKGGWVEEGGTWNQLNQYSIDKNVVVRAVVSTSSVGVDNETRLVSLIQNYPNPFSASTTFKINLERSGFISLKIFNPLGQEIYTVVNKQYSSGEHEISFNGEKLPSGVYFYTLEFQPSGSIDPPTTYSKKMIIMK